MMTRKPPIGRVIKADLAAMAKDDILSDGEAQPGSTPVSVLRDWSSLKNGRNTSSRNSGAIPGPLSSTNDFQNPTIT